MYDSEQEIRPIPPAPPLTLPTLAGPRRSKPLSNRRTQKQQQEWQQQQRQMRKKQQLPKAWKDENVVWLKKTKAWQQVNRILTKSLDLTAELQQGQDHEQYYHHHHHHHQQQRQRQRQRQQQKQKGNLPGKSNEGGCSRGGIRDSEKSQKEAVNARKTAEESVDEKKTTEKEQDQQEKNEDADGNDVGVCVEGDDGGSRRKDEDAASSGKTDEGESAETEKKPQQQQHLQQHLDQHTRMLSLPQKMALMMESRTRLGFLDTLQASIVCCIGGWDGKRLARPAMFFRHPVIVAPSLSFCAGKSRWYLIKNVYLYYVPT